MHKKSSGTRDTENEVRIDLIKEVLTKIKKAIENVPKDDVLKIEEKKEIIDVVQRILKLDNKFQSGKRTKNSRSNAYYITSFFSTIKSRK